MDPAFVDFNIQLVRLDLADTINARPQVVLE